MGEDIALQLPALALQFLSPTEQVRVIGHVEHRHEGEAPRVCGALPVRVRLAFQDRDSSVDAERDLRVASAAEHRKGPGVGVDQ
jgi:hypothetical protein